MGYGPNDPEFDPADQFLDEPYEPPEVVRDLVEL